MRRAPVFVLAGTLAGFLGALAFHPRAAISTAAPPVTGHVGQSGSAGDSGRSASKRGAGGSGGQASPTGLRNALGVLEQYGYGELSVRVTMRGSRIINVTVPLIRTAEQYSQQLAAQVIPQLRSEVLAGQTANISAVSGASYTSQAYAASVQAALDKLRS